MSGDLHHHLVGDHGRPAYELRGLPLADVHHLEHLDATLGLLHLNHQHPGDDLTGVAKGQP